ncbi:MAG: hypothetical protein ACTSUC_15020 [Promethearchaeota archaeon]
MACERTKAAPERSLCPTFGDKRRHAGFAVFKAEQSTTAGISFWALYSSSRLWGHNIGIWRAIH